MVAHGRGGGPIPSQDLIEQGPAVNPGALWMPYHSIWMLACQHRRTLTNLKQTGNIFPMNQGKLTQDGIEAVFERLDMAAKECGIDSLTLVAIGSAVLIKDGMPGRATIDIDFWKTTDDESALLAQMARRAGIDFDPDDYRDRQEPYLQMVVPDFVHMPLTEEWRKHTELVWAGDAIKIERPPIGIIVGSKLAAARDQDYIDVAYVVGAHPHWREDLDRWIGHFSDEDQEDIRDNVIFAELCQSNAVSPLNPNQTQVTETDNTSWIDSLHPKRQGEFRALSPEHQAMVMARGVRTRRNALRVLDHQRRGLDGREHWVNGLEQLKDFIAEPTHLLRMAFAGNVDAVEAAVDILIDFQAGEHDSVRHTDPYIHGLMRQALSNFDLHGHGGMDLVAMAQYFKENPDRKPLTGRYPDAQQVAKKKALRVGARLKSRRRELKLTQEDLAHTLGTCGKTIKNMEAGKPVSSHTLLMAQGVLESGGPASRRSKAPKA